MWLPWRRALKTCVYFPTASSRYIFSPCSPCFISFSCNTCCCLVSKSCLTLCDPMDCSLRGSSVHGIFQARILEWVAMPSSRGSFWPRDWTQVSCIGRPILYCWAIREAFSLSRNNCFWVLWILPKNHQKSVWLGYPCNNHTAASRSKTRNL